MSQQIKAGNNGRMIDKGALERTATNAFAVQVVQPMMYVFRVILSDNFVSSRTMAEEKELQGHKDSLPMAFLLIVTNQFF